MLKIPLWEAIILFVISRVMLSSQTKYCNENNISLLRTVGVIFSDSEKRITQYIK